MPATVEVKQAYGGSDGSPSEAPVSGDISALRFHTADQYNPTDTTTPIPIPTSGYKHSFWVHIYLKLSGTFTKINNVRHSCPTIDWPLGTGGELRRGRENSMSYGGYTTKDIECYPLAASGPTVDSPATAWSWGSWVEIVPANTIQNDFSLLEATCFIDR